MIIIDMMCDGPGCMKRVEGSNYILLKVEKWIAFCGLACLCRWVLLQPIDWSGKEPWRE